MNRPTRLLRFVITLVILAGVILPAGSGQAAGLQPQEVDPWQQAQALVAQMSPEEKVGQLFLVTFDGTDVGPNSRIYSLIHDYHIGGVILRADNDNFTGPSGTVASTSQMISDLQSVAWEASQNEVTDPVTRQVMRTSYAPLFVGLSQEGDLIPYDQIIHGMTALPNLMAIGATWNPALAEQVGAALGTELSATGFNLFLGPSLDVLDVIHTESSEDLGTRTFGGDPYWVGEMGMAYIRGLHRGSNQRLAVIAKHFPGRGGSDRSPENEVATVRKSLEQLKQIELAPFFAVTGNAPDATSMTDGLLVSHIRYQGFQGNIRATTRPVSLDAAALEQVLGLEPLQRWRQNGGIVVSDDLGSAAIRRSSDPTGQSFDARQVARTAFMSGNDLLYVDNFVATNDQDAYTTILRTLELFTQKYIEDPAFAQRVDLSVTRILALKYRLYPGFNIDNVLPKEADLSAVGRSQTVTFEVARQGVTLISPDPAELSLILPRPPELRDRIVFLTDVLSASQCSTCAERAVVSTDALESTVLRLYGPEAGGQILEILLSSYSFSELSHFMDDPASEQSLENDLRQADWIVVGMLNPQPWRSSSDAFKRLLSERSELLRNKRVIAFSFNAPYYLDATDISKLTAYYGLYSKAPSFFEVAARILFQELPTEGALPVSVPGVGYDLIVATSPDPDQAIPLFIESESQQTVPTDGTPEPTQSPSFRVGDNILLRTGVVYDHNGNPVPDGTIVRFLFTSGTDASATQQIEQTTLGGVAQASFRINNPGVFEFRVVSDPAIISSVIRLEVVEGQNAEASIITPSPFPTETPTVTPTITPTITPTPTEVPIEPPPPPVGGWFLSMIVIWGSTAGIFLIGRTNNTIRWAIRWGLLAAVGGLIAYTLMVAVFAKTDWFAAAGTPGIIAGTLAGVVIGWGAGYSWKRWLTTPVPAHHQRKTNESL
ncbi:MAG TPA: glycoside hydrolase family 3 N-terminal domain-containing protein [Anaerolineaceae bacterium]|nr:glycoside hydrolase family 3 N-terminal domain-containing protein [Anaerolineaceae bacterium]